MARTGFGSGGGWQADDNDRVASGGKNALVTEIVNVVASSSAVTLYNRKATKYYGGASANTDLFTTGAAILSDIMHVKAVIPVLMLATGAFTTTTESRPLTAKIINGPTTLAVVYAPGITSGSTVRIVVMGKTF